MTTPAYADALRTLLETHAKPVQFTDKARWRNPNIPEISAYNDWVAYEAYMHAVHPAQEQFGGGCGWVIEPGAEVTEEEYTEWGGTFGENTHTIGINVSPARCRCGRYANMTLRYEKGLGAALRDLFGVPMPLTTL